MVSEPLIQNGTDITLGLKHFRNSRIDYILKKTDYDSMNDYESLARDWNNFYARINEEGYLCSEPPKVDDTKFALFELSIHHLERRVLNRIMDYYIGMDLLDYELLYPHYNTIYVKVPYKSWVLKMNTVDENGLYPTPYCNCVWCDGTIDYDKIKIVNPGDKTEGYETVIWKTSLWEKV